MSPVIEGAYGPLKIDAFVGGTDEVQTASINATGGTFRLGFGGFATGDIAWSATNGTLLANINAKLQGTAEVSTLTFANITSGTFRLRFHNQTSAKITWSGTSNTLRDRIDTALEALAPIGTSGCVTATGTMTNGIGTMTVTFAALGPQGVIEVTDQRFVKIDDTLTTACVTSAITTPGTGFGIQGIVASDSNLASGVGDFLLTFSGPGVAKKAQPLVTVVDNQLTGAGTLTIAETTPGVDATFKGAPIGAIGTDNTDGKQYTNTGTPAAPTWTLIGGQS